MPYRNPFPTGLLDERRRVLRYSDLKRGETPRSSRIRRNGTKPRTNSVAAKTLDVLRRLRSHKFTGDPKQDWLACGKLLQDSGAAALREIAQEAEKLIAFLRGRRMFDEPNSSPFMFQPTEAAPRTRCRKLLRVGVTRARHHVLLLTDMFTPTELLKGHIL